MPTPIILEATTPNSSSDDVTAAMNDRSRTAVEKITNIHAEGTVIPIALSYEKCISTTWGVLCQDVVHHYLTTVNPTLILQILTKMSPKNERVTHYVLRYGDGNASLIRVIWSSAEEVMPAYIEANAVLKPRRLWEKLQNNAAMPHLPVQPMMQHSADVDLCISLVASAQNNNHDEYHILSVLYLKEHAHFPGCVDTFSVVEPDERNTILPVTAHVMPEASIGQKKRKAAPSQTAEIAPAEKDKPKMSTDDDDEDDAKKLLAKEECKGGTVATAGSMKKKKKNESHAPESAVVGSSDPNESSGDVICLHEEETTKGKKLEDLSSDKFSMSAKKSSAAMAMERSGDDCSESSVEFADADIIGNDLMTHAVPHHFEMKASRRDIQKGLHPTTKLNARNCICARSQCWKVVSQYAAMGNAKMTKYLDIPNYPPQANTETKKYKVKFLDCLARYFPHLKNKPKAENTFHYLSITHFPPTHRDIIWNPPTSFVKRWRISLSVGRASGLKEQHKCRFGGERFHFATPMLDHKSIVIELGETIRADLLQKRGPVLNSSQSLFLEKFRASHGYTPITKNDCGIDMQVLTANEALKTRSSARLKGKQITCQCKQNHPNCVHSECANNNEFGRECNKSNCSFGETDCGNRFTTPKQVKAQSRALLVVEEFKSDQYGDPRVGRGAKAIVPFSEHEIIGEYVDEVKKREGDMSNYCVDIGEGYVIDSEKKGNTMRFIQHSCDPNCELIVRVHQDMRKRVWIRANKAISAGEWITFKYHPNPSVLQQSFFNNKGCVCGSKNCIKPRKISIQDGAVTYMGNNTKS
jgi:hypothetical protein